MRAELDATGTKKEPKLDLLRRYGWGVPTEEAVLRSSRQAVTLITQDIFVPFEGSDYKMRRFRLHALPWPTEVLETIGAGDVTLKSLSPTSSSLPRHDEDGGSVTLTRLTFSGLT